MKKILCTLLSAAIAAALVCGCGKKTANSDMELTNNLGTEYPLKTEETLSVWCFFPNDAMDGAKTLNDLPLGQNLEKLSGVHIDYTHPPTGGESESFNLLLASGELPDIIMYNWPIFPGGADKAINDGYIMQLNDIVDEYCPDFKKALNEYDARKFFSTDEGKLYYFPGIWNGNAVNTGGLMLRKDWLDDLGMSVPETIDEWHDVLAAFKNEKGAQAPLSVTLQAFQDGAFSGAFGIKLGYYVEDGKVKNGYMEDDYKDFLKKMIEWKKEGIFDKNFTTIDNNTILSNCLVNKTGATYGGQGQTMGGLINGNHRDASFDLVAAPYPVLKKGEKCNIAKKNTQAATQMGAAITTSCKNVELAAKWLNFGYTQAGAYAYAFGVEGESFTIENGYPTFTDFIMHNPDGASVKSMLDRYTRSATASGPFIKDYRYLEQYAQLPQQKECLVVWSDQDGESHELPPLFFDKSEQSVVSEKTNAVKTYQEEMLYRFLNETESIDNFDSYIENMKKNGADDILAAYQSAYKRYLGR